MMNARNTTVAAGLLLIGGLLPSARAEMMHHQGMMMDETGMIMNANPDRLPRDCPQISETVELTIRAGHEHAKKFPGKMFAYDQQEWNVKPCAKINITFINDDHVRHQMMIHGLPGYLYPEGMLHLELFGHGQLKASLILPSRKKTYLVHCELPQHQEKGMKAQLKVDGGDGDLPSIPGLTEPAKADVYPVNWNRQHIGMALFSILIGTLAPFLLRIKKNKAKKNEA
ncbi:copper oxidase [Methylomicrobium sp. Wu6]|uniref:copper oxidase n=1 Tax=Methylomicrobium sp. Wu6 TaxID=3107928 RepID=UPI002DD623F2|nr:copper oxidase [Methylomicrobium sp. Wu6]MEC4748034.1 copper oxidase [Methylomicrobium sp. Wu6]